jgi:hypothetical protein
MTLRNCRKQSYWALLKGDHDDDNNNNNNFFYNYLESRKNTKNCTGKPIQKLTIYKIRHSKTDVNKVYVEGKEGKEGKRGLLKVEAT